MLILKITVAVVVLGILTLVVGAFLHDASGDLEELKRELRNRKS